MRLAQKPEIPGSIHSPVCISVEIDHRFFFTVIFPLPLAYEGQCQ